jgi:hypothetical protein
MQDKIIENPYAVLGVSPLASDTEITKAFGVAMKQRKYPADAIAKARKSLMNPDERIIADYLNPIIPLVKRFRSLELNETDRHEDLMAGRSAAEQIDRLIQVEIDKLAGEDRDSDIELANLVWD